MNNIDKAPDYLDDPHLSQQTKEYLKVLNSGDKPVESLPIADARKVLEDAQSSVNVDLSGIEESEKTITQDGYTIKLNIVRPQGNKNKLPVFIFIHGGGWVLGDYPTHKRLVRDLVVTSGFCAVFVNYSPSPEAKYPTAINEIYAATKWVSQHGEEINVDGKKLAVVGNSVGGNMSIVTSLRAKEENGPEIKVQLLLWPVTDATFDWDSYTLYGKQRFLTTPLMKWMFDQYTTNEEERKNIHLSPLQASIEELRGLPPTLITVAENDILRDQGEALGRKLDEAGVRVSTIRFNGVIHDWGMLNGYARIPETCSLIGISAAMLKYYLQ
ncbi:MAG: alpha/beta hydrolase [Prevotella sp.]|jgi:acetyl esterase/lipase|nr:alpha/beta hydrolase [Prevotella sp.]